ncbi:hypothetical protein SUGI_0452550 [Cryptomeria japonica]|uniref:protein MODIFYING WALL LIGNIN-1 n=1 Tax=Cryptomeria japonica TaxID=3369 RepID=UPI002408CC73|nr:protein MODIFYING WALL LIGNIN-1 [Cryptomeria japonica]GLJ23828.1 hypothetical protein SUGI_0452550 [Cryptomeria japonica]
MKKSVQYICTVVGVLGVIAFVLSIAAEVKHNKAAIEKDGHGRCIYRRKPAFVLGYIAALALLIAQIIINVAVCCFCCRNRTPNRARWRTTVAIICAILSWFTFLVAFSMLVVGASLNKKKGVGYFSTHCYVIKKGAFAVAGILSLATVALGIVSYIIASAVESLTPLSHRNRSIAMTQSHSVPLNPQPVFVPEILYNQ